jgi:trehalose 6-phosphate synthase/phosphatase
MKGPEPEETSVVTASQATRLSADQLLKHCGDRPIAICLDYDGTIFPIVRVPGLAKPDESLLSVLTRLSERPDLYLSIISGRDRDVLTSWFGHLPIHLFAEHGAWERPGRGEWLGKVHDGSVAWKRQVRQIMDRVTIELPGSFVEEKSQSVVWHYRMCDPEIASIKARELNYLLVDSLANSTLKVTCGKKIVEVRTAGVHKGDAIITLRRMLADKGHVFVALGDDTTDEDMFRCLPEDGIAVHVGDGGGARFSLRDVAEARKFLSALDRRPVIAGVVHPLAESAGWKTSGS